VAEVLECAGGQIRRLSRKNFINPRMIRLAIDTDQELRTLLSNVDIADGGGRVLEILPKNSVGNICKSSVEKYVEISEEEEYDRTDTEPRSRKPVPKSNAKSSQRNKSRKKKASLVQISLISDEESDKSEEARRTETVFLARPFKRAGCEAQETSPRSADAALPCSRYCHHNWLGSKKQKLKSDKQKSVSQGKFKFKRIVQLSSSDEETQPSNTGERLTCDGDFKTKVKPTARLVESPIFGDCLSTTLPESPKKKKVKLSELKVKKEEEEKESETTDNMVLQLPMSLQKSSSGVNNGSKKKQSEKFKHKSAASKKKQNTGIDVSIVISSDDDSEEGKMEFLGSSRERKCEKRNHTESRNRVLSSNDIILIE